MSSSAALANLALNRAVVGLTSTAGALEAADAPVAVRSLARRLPRRPSAGARLPTADLDLDVLAAGPVRVLPALRLPDRVLMLELLVTRPLAPAAEEDALDFRRAATEVVVALRAKRLVLCVRRREPLAGAAFAVSERREHWVSMCICRASKSAHPFLHSGQGYVPGASWPTPPAALPPDLCCRLLLPLLPAPGLLFVPLALDESCTNPKSEYTDSQ